jgi:integrase
MASQMGKISKRAVDALITAAEPKVIRDEDLTGFGARLNANGSVSYLVEYRAGRGRGFPVRRLVIGKHGALTPDKARSLAKAMLARVVAGDDPAAERAGLRKQSTVGDLLRHSLETHWGAKSKPTTLSRFTSTINHSLIPEFGSLRLSELTRARIRTWHAKQTNRKRQANLDLAILRKALSLAVKDEVLKENPAKGIEPYPERQRDRVPSDEELKAILGVLDSLDIRPQAALLFKLLALTGARTSEWRTAEWSWVDTDGRTLRLPDAKAGARPIVLSGAVQALLAAATRSSRYVIPNDAGDAPLTPSIVSKAWEAVRSASGVGDLRVHDLRHGFATRGGALGASAVILRDALGHKTLAMTNRYVSRQIDPVRDLAERIGAQIEAVGTGKTGEVVKLKKRRTRS